MKYVYLIHCSRECISFRGYFWEFYQGWSKREPDFYDSENMLFAIYKCDSGYEFSEIVIIINKIWS